LELFGFVLGSDTLPSGCILRFLEVEEKEEGEEEEGILGMIRDLLWVNVVRREEGAHTGKGKKKNVPRLAHGRPAQTLTYLTTFPISHHQQHVGQSPESS
jgi:hypothetical protein